VRRGQVAAGRGPGERQLMMIIPEPHRRSLSQVEAALGRVQQSADAFRRAAVGDPVETVAKPAADPRLVELLKLVEEQRADREDPRTNRDVWRDLSRAITLHARAVSAWVQRCRASASAAILLLGDHASRSSKRQVHKLARVRVTLRRVRNRCTHTAREAMDRVLQRLQIRLHDNAEDFQELLVQFDRELQAHSNRLAVPQRIADQHGAEDPQNKPADLDELGATLWRRVLNTIGRDAIKDQTSDWSAYFQGLRDLVTITITNISSPGLSPDQRALLFRQLIERIDRFERSWPVSNGKVVGTAQS
jgi:hypothetical protein